MGIIKTLELAELWKIVPTELANVLREESAQQAATIANLRAQLSTLESAKPLAVLPGMPDIVILRNAESWTTIWWTSRPTREAVEYMMEKYPDAVREDLYLAKNIQPVAPDLLAALNRLADSVVDVNEEGWEPVYGAEQIESAESVVAHRARLAAGKGGEG